MKKFIAVLFLSFFAISIWSQTVESIVGKYLENIGGVEKWKSVKSAKLEGTVPTPQGDFSFEMLRKAPNKIMISLDIMGQKFVPQAFDGETGWMINPFMGDPNPQKLPEDQLKAAKQDADFEDPFIDYASKGREVTYIGTSDVDGVKCYEVKLVKNKGKEDETVMSYFFDADTYLPLVVKQTPSAGQMAGQEMSVFYSDYQDTGNGLIMPYTIDTKMGGQ